MTDSPALLRRLTLFRGDYSRRAYSLDAGDIEVVLGMGRELALLLKAVEAAETVFAETRAYADCYVAYQIFEDAVREYREVHRE